MPRFPKDDPAFTCLRLGDVDGYRTAIEGRREIDLSDVDLRGVDLRHVDLSKVVLRGAYLRDTDLRGVDLRQHDLDGCSLMGARVSGTWFPANISASEIRLSLESGVRLRARH